MKKLLLFIISVVLFSCQKETVQQVAPRTVNLSCDVKYLPNGASFKRRPDKPRGNPHIPPTDTTTTPPQPPPTPPPPSGDTTQNVMFCDFDGGILSNSQFGSFSYDSAGLSESAMDSIVERGREAFDTFNLVITRDETLFNATDPTHRQKIIFTTYSSWYGTHAGGVAFLNSFGQGEVAFVFTQLLYFDTRLNKEAFLHEAGHTLNCQHQATWDENCVLITPYRQFCIMGLPWNQSVVNEWVTGKTPASCNSYQDDKAQIASVVGYK